MLTLLLLKATIRGAGFKPKIKVCGIGGGGGNAVNTLISRKIPGIDYVVCNTDIQALRYVHTRKKAERKGETQNRTLILTPNFMK